MSNLLSSAVRMSDSNALSAPPSMPGSVDVFEYLFSSLAFLSICDEDDDEPHIVHPTLYIIIIQSCHTWLSSVRT